jgi:aspartate carbamoyltransferase catalytic subunit
MPLLGRSLLDTRVLSAKEIDEIFLKADALGKSLATSKTTLASEIRADLKGPVICCLFFEPSTRTRMSFQMAAYRLGFQVLTMELSAGSSLSKGETLTDTVLNFAAMRPDLLVVRYGSSRELDNLLPTLDVPVLNAGSGTMAHPTQGLLDAYTLRQEWGPETDGLKGKRVLIFGDVLHSRVARSNFDVLTKLGAEVGVFGPANMLPSEKAEGGVMAEYKIRIFDTLDEALPWADACMGLRIQLERHETKELDSNYLSQYGLTRERLRLLKDDAVILHPGPINHGVEFATEVVEDRRSRVLKQVTNGVTIRAALLAMILGV